MEFGKIMHDVHMFISDEERENEERESNFIKFDPNYWLFKSRQDRNVMASFKMWHQPSISQSTTNHSHGHCQQVPLHPVYPLLHNSWSLEESQEDSQWGETLHV